MFHVEHVLKNFFDIKDLEPLLFLEKEYFKWVNKINISAIKTKEGFWRDHIFDSLCLCKFLKEEKLSFSSLYDLGSGAGFPGLILSMFFPNKVYLVEPVKKKTDFSRHVSRHLGLKNLEVLNVKYQDLEIPNPAETILVSRALGDFDNVVGYFNGFSKIVFMTSVKESKNIKNRNFILKGEEIYSELNKHIKEIFLDKAFVCF